MSRNRFFFILTFVVAVALRFIFLSWKPPHFDESINGWFVSQVWEHGFYNYDPNNFHGPLFFYYLQLFNLLFGKSVEVMRAATGLISLAIIYFIFAHRRFVGAIAHWAALFIAISAAFVFYSRYAIHESLFILGQVLFSYGYFSWKEKRTWNSCAQMIVAVFILATTKETYFIFLGTWVIAVAGIEIIQKTLKQPIAPAKKLPLTEAEKNRVLQVAIFCGIALYALFSNLFSDPNQFLEFFNALAIWSKTGSGKSGHEKPFVYWIYLLWRYEWPMLLALLLTPLATLKKGATPIRVLALFGFGTWLAYSLIPYKTPWLIMGMLWPLAFVLGWGIEKLRAKYNSKILLALSVLFIVSPLIQTLRLNFIQFTNDAEPYVYVQSTKDVGVIMRLVEEQVKRSPADFNMHLEVMTEEGWPFPFIYGGYPNLHYMKIAGFDESHFNSADVIFYDGKDSDVIENRLHGLYYRIPLQLRSAYNPGFALFRVGMFKGLLPENTMTKGKP